MAWTARKRGVTSMCNCFSFSGAALNESDVAPTLVRYIVRLLQTVDCLPTDG